MITGNKGEWSEIYALFKLLGDQELFPGNSNLERLEDLVYPVIKILRTENNGKIEYSIKDELVLISDEREVLKVPIDIFKRNAHLLLDTIKKKEERTFSIPKIEEFMQSINCMSLKAGSSAKTDITVVIHDHKTNQQPKLGFSIKSQLGSPSTLLNAGKTTNFIYKINNVQLTDPEISQINAISGRRKVIDRLNAILDKGGDFQFVKTEKQIFSNNLVLIDSSMPLILANIVMLFYTSKLSSLDHLLEKTSLKNPLGFDTQNGHQFYEYKVKRFLTDVALGMMPSKVWTGKYDATGGYLVIKENGDVLCYHVYNKNEFENYLLNNTKLDTPSTSRYNFGEIYKIEDQLYFALNLQIRFTR